MIPIRAIPAGADDALTVTVLPISFFPATGFVSQLASHVLPFELPSIDVSMLWHRRHQHEPAHAWLRDTVTQVATEVSANTASGH